MDNKKYIITGAPGTGKTSIITELKKRDFSCSKEISRDIIAEQIKKKGDILPWKDLNSFSQRVFLARLTQFINTPNNINHFFDRGVIDVIAYMKLENHETSHFESKLKNIKYNKKVFYTPIWKDIYVKDVHRKESISKAIKIENQLLKIYKKHNYKMIEIPKFSVEERTDFIISYI